MFPGRKASDVGDLLGGLPFQVEKNHLPVQRSKPVNQCLKLGQFSAAVVPELSPACAVGSAGRASSSTNRSDALRRLER